MHIATDGETLWTSSGARRHGPRIRARLLEHSGYARLTNYAEFLEKQPPTHDARIFEKSSWSCAHGVDRWRAACGCNSGAHGNWHQRWRAPLREAIDWLRDELAPRFEEQGLTLFQDPWHARDQYISVVLDRTRESVDRFLERHASHPLSEQEQIRALQLMELQRHAMLMYTSCGWFFDELSGIETVQVLQYAARALQLGQELFDENFDEGFSRRLEFAESNLPEHRNGKVIYERCVKPAMVDLQKVGAHYAISSLFEEFAPNSRIYAFDVTRQDFQTCREGKAQVALGRAQIRSRITWETATLSFGVLHLGDQNVSGGVRDYIGDSAYCALVSEVKGVFERGDVPNLIRAVDRNFGTGTFSLGLLFRDQQRKIVGLIMERALLEAASLYRGFYSQYSTLARFLTELNIRPPARFQMAVDFTLNEELLNALSKEEPSAEAVKALLEQVRRTGILVDTVTLEFAFRRTVERAAELFEANPFDLGRIRRFDEVMSLCESLPFSTNLWAAQNLYHLAQRSCLQVSQTKNDRDPGWKAAFDCLGAKLGFAIKSVGADAATAG